ncbi:MAG: ATP-binding cassette domain-containing protein [Treponema sp.]|nr:ATP-binding cassette domain-containing protein [Treponema sp.]
MFFLRESSLDGYAAAYPAELSGGQRQRASIARAWAYPAPIILMDEPFQSLDIPLKIQLIDSVKRLMRAESRFIAAVTHDPREAVYLGRRIIVLGMPPEGGAANIVFDETFELPEKRSFVSEAGILLEKKLIAKLQAGAPAAASLDKTGFSG